MLQPRKTLNKCSSSPNGYLHVLCLIGLVFLPVVRLQYTNKDNSELLLNNVRAGERIKRDGGEVTILSLEENTKGEPAIGLLSSTARTFVHGGTTTEFATQVVGTTLGRTYARLLSTGSRVFYDNSRPSSRDRVKPTASDAYLVFPTSLPKLQTSVNTVPFRGIKSGGLFQTAVRDRIEPTRTIVDDVVASSGARYEDDDDEVPELPEVLTNHETSYDKRPVDDLFDLSDSKRSINKVYPPINDDENIVSVHREYSVKRNSAEVKPAKVVKPKNDLPTFTVRHEFAPSGYSHEDEEEKKQDGLLKPSKRNGKTLFRGGIPIKQEKKLDTVTYYGFADFTTTVGDTVIIFMPKTPTAPQGSVTSIVGDATLRPEDGVMPVVTSVKTFMSHSPGMATKTVTGHSLSMNTKLPTVLVDRESKAFAPVYVPENAATDEPEPEVESATTPMTEESSVIYIDPSAPSIDYSEELEPSIEPYTTEEIASTEATPTEPLSTYATTMTQVYNADEEALGLVKSIGGTEAFNGTTTIFTSFVYGTFIDGKYAQLIQSASSVFINVGDNVITTTGVGIGIAPSSASESITATESPVESTEHEEKDVTIPEPPPTTEYTTADEPQPTTPENVAQDTDNVLSNEVDTARKIDSLGRDQVIVDNYNQIAETVSPATGYITRLIPTTEYKTFTYLTTFFIPNGDGGDTTTSIRSREVTSEEVSYITTLVPENFDESTSVSQNLMTIAPTEVITSSEMYTATPEDVPTTEQQEKEEKPETTSETTTSSTTESTTATTSTTTTTTEKEEEIIPETPQPPPPPPTTETAENFEEETSPQMSPTPVTTPKGEEEVELIFKTLYTTYTYLTTFFQETTTSVSSREVVVTNVVTTTLDNGLLEASDPAVAGLFAREDSIVTSFPSASVYVEEPAPTSVGVGRPTTKYFEDTMKEDDLFTSTIDSVDYEKELSSPTPALEDNEISDNGIKTFYTTYTYFTTIFVDGETEVESRTEVYTNLITPSSVMSEQIEPTSFVPDDFSLSEKLPSASDVIDQVEPPEDVSETSKVLALKSTPSYSYASTIIRQKNNEENILESVVTDVPELESSNADNAYKYDMTMSRNHNVGSTHIVGTDETTGDTDSEMSAREAELSKEEKLLIGASPVSDDTEVYETMVIDVTSSSSGGRRKYYREADSNDHNNDDQITSESNTEEIEPSFSPTLLLQTSYTTFTYFTTVYKGSSSDVISRLETVTNVVTETVRLDASSLSPEEATLPITYFTTYTYWTTLYKDGSTRVTSREETVSNVVTPTVTSMETTQTVEITPTVTSDLILPTLRTEVIGGTTPSETATETSVSLEPTTFFTTYTYFTTSYIGNSTVLNSRLETITNVVTPTLNSTSSVDTESTTVVEDINVINTTPVEKAINVTEPRTSVILSSKPTGLLSTIKTSEIVDGTTTLLFTDVYGTYIDGLYAQVLESSTQVVTPTGPVPSSTSPPSYSSQSTGVVSLNEGKIVDADGVSTTFYVTKALGTFIDQLYAQVIESTTSVKVDEEKKTSLQALEPSTTTTGSKTFKTGLVRLIEGSIIKDKTTTFYESRVIGTLIDGRYAQIIESTSSFKIEMSSTPVQSLQISPTTTTSGSKVEATASLTTTTTTTSPTPAVIESSLTDEAPNHEENEDHDDEDEEDDDSSSGRGRVKSRLSFSSRKKTFTPVIRPFASRPRPTFLPKKKSGDVGSATTITRAAFTPTITATPAVKSSERGFGTSRNRFASGRRSSSSSVYQSASSAGRRYSRPRGGTSSSASSSSTYYRGRSSTGRISPTATTGYNGSRRGGFNYRTTAGGGRGSSEYPGRSSAAGSSRYRIRPTLSSGIGRFPQSSTSSTTTEDIFNTNDIGGTTIVTEETLYTSADEEQETSPPTSTTESPRRGNNPLLRFRRPPILQRPSTTTTTAKPTTTSARRNPLLRRPDSRSPTTPITPTRNKPAPAFNARTRQRPSNSLFPPRGLLRKPTPAEEADENDEKEEENNEENAEQEEEERLEEEEDIGDNEYEGSENSESKQSTTAKPEAQKSDRRGKAFNTVQIRPFTGFRRPRAKRQTSEYGTRNFRPRNFRPSARSSTVDVVEDNEPVPTETPSRTSGRFTPRSKSLSQPRVRPTSASSNAGRSQFTLREKSIPQQNGRSNFRPRSNSNSGRRRPIASETTSVPKRPKPPRLRSQSTAQQTESATFSRSNGRRFSNSRRPTSRSRYRETTDFDTYTFSQSSFDGTITVTHQIPTEVTIPVVNGKITEYKNIITAKPSLEILGPHQYSTTTGKDGSPLILLTSEVTGTLPNGVMEVTRFIVYETPTTSVTFTPTVLRGRKTSFSHIVPSTVYDVKQEVNTIQPQIAPNAPLANLLLSQLLLGNLGLQQTINPLLALNNQPLVQPTPTTEFKTKTTTYVTTVTDHTSTVIPLTFRGKEILTTIVDSSTQVITATEYLTETVVVTPTVPLGGNQFNSLLLPALLQAQLLGQPQQLQQPALTNPLLGTLQQQLIPQDILNIQEEKLDYDEPTTQRFVSRRRPAENNDPQLKEIDDINIDTQKPEPKLTRKKKIKGKKPPDPPINPAETSIVTLYVSGRRPGDFSTVLSTVTLGEESSVSVKKREIAFEYPDIQQAKLESSKLPEIGGSFPGPSDEGYLNYYIMPAFNDISVEGSEIETQSLESIVGDVSQYVSIDHDTMSTRPVETLQPSLTKDDPSINDFKLASSKSNKKYTGHFLSKSPAEFAPNQRIGTSIWSNQTSEPSDSNTDYMSEVFLIGDDRSRSKRDADEDTTQSPRRRRVRVRVPVQKRINIDEDLTPSEAQRAHEITPQDVLQTQDAAYQKIQEFGTRKIKIIRKKTKNEENQEAQETNPVTPHERNPTHQRRRVAVRRRRPTTTNSEESTSYFPSSYTDDFQTSTYSTYRSEPVTHSETTHKRRRVLVTKKRPLLTTSFAEPSIVPTHTRRRIVITKKRPIKKQEVASVDPFSTLSPEIVTGMTTLYDYRYSVPAEDQTEKMVTVSQLFLSGQVPDSSIPEYDVNDSYSRFSLQPDVTEIKHTTEVPSETTSSLETTPEIPRETQSFFWFYEPTDSYIIDVLPTTTPVDEMFSSVPVIPITYEENFTEESISNLGSSTEKTVDKPVSYFEEEITTVEPVSEIPILESSETPTIEPSTEIGFEKNTQDLVHSETQSLHLSETSINVEETSQYDGPPRFVRPTRFSVTRKPTKSVSNYPGRRRKPVYSETTTPSTTTTTKPSYRYRKNNTRKHKYSSSRKFSKSTTNRPFSVITSTPVIEDVVPTDVEDKVDPTKSADLPLNTPDLMPSVEHEYESSSTVSPSISLETEPLSSSSKTVPLKPELSPDTVNAMPVDTQTVPETTDISYTTTVVTSTRLRTYTYVVTRVSGDESITASSTTVKPAVKTLTLTLPVSNTVQQKTASVEEEGRGLGIGEARYNLATKVMSNGVEVIVAGDKSTLPGEPEVLRVLPTSLSRPITLAPSTLTDHMMMLLPQGNQNIQEFVTKTYLTTYTYLTTLLQDGVTVVSSNEKIISNVVTEELKATPIMPTSATQMTLSSSPSLATGVFHTTYTYLNTLVDGEVPLVVTSKKTVSNTVTAPEDYMSMLQPSEPVIQDTNTYLSTVAFTKTLNDGLDTKVVSTEDILTQVIITETDSKASSVDIKPTPTPLTTDVVKTYFVTYTYYSTMLDGDDTVVHSKVATSSDIVTEKFILTPKRTSTPFAEKLTSEEKIPITDVPSPIQPTNTNDNSINIYATKTYLTTFTYFTTLLQDNNGKTPSTVIKSRTKVVQNVVTEAVDTNLLDSEYLLSLRSSLNNDRIPIVGTATLNDGQKMEITAMQDGGALVKPTASPLDSISSSFEETTASKNNVVTGSTIIFFDENDQIDSTIPSSSSSRTLAIEVAGHTKISSSSVTLDDKPTDTVDELLSASESVHETTQALPLIGSLSSEPVQSYTTLILTTSTVTKNGATLRPGDQVIMLTNSDGNVTMIPVSDPVTKHPDGTTQTGLGSDVVVGDLLNLGSFGINGLNALGPVINAMAGLIQSNLNSDVTYKKNETILYPVTHKPKPLQVSTNPLLTYAGPKPPPIRSPIYIPVGGLAADSVAEESQNVEGHNVFTDTDQRTKPQVILGRPTMESPLLAGGIPISPGQVITANSDVIIGKPAILGPRPPDLGKPYGKNEVPIGMKPPPLPPPSPSLPYKVKPAWPLRDQNGHYIPFNQQHRLPHPNMESHPHFHIHRRPVSGAPQKHQQLNGEPYHIPLRDHTHNYDTIHYAEEFERYPEAANSAQQYHHHHHHYNVEPPGRVPPSNLPLPSNVPHTHIKPGNDAHYTQVGENIQHQQQATGNVPVSPGSYGNTQYRPDTRDEYLSQQPAKQEYNDVVPHLRPPSVNNHHYINQNIREHENVPTKESIPSNVLLKPKPNKHLQAGIPGNEIGYVNPIHHQPILLPDSPEFLDHSTVNPLLVNIQPSQVANVIIPHGSSTALIYNGEPAEHSQKGEIFNDPSPYPDAEVDHVVDALSTARPPHEGEGVTQAALLPSNAIQMDVPVGPQGINVAAGQQRPHPVFIHDTQTGHTHHNHQPPSVILHQAINTKFHENHQVIQTPPSGLEYMTPPPPGRPHELTDDYIFGEEPTDTEGGEVVQESNSRPLRPGQLPIELTVANKPSTSMPIDPIDDVPLKLKPIKKPETKPNFESAFNTKPDSSINFSIVNSKPVQLDGNNLSINPPAIINGKPGLTTFGNNAQATVSIGSPTKLKPEFMAPGEMTDEEKQEFNHNDRPTGTNLISSPPHKVHNEHSPFDTPIHVKPHHETHKIPSEYDNIVIATSVKEKLPSPFDVNPQQRPSAGELGLAMQANIPRPFSKPNLSQFDRNSQSQEETVVGLQPPPQILHIPQDSSARPTGNPPRRPVPPQRVKPRPPPPYKFEIPPPPPPPASLPPKPKEPMITATTKPKLPSVQRIPQPTEMLSPPKPGDNYYDKVILFDKKPPSSERPNELDQWLTPTTFRPITKRPDSINPVLGGVLTVEDLPQKPEVITADSKVVLTNVIKGHRNKPEGIRITGSQPALQTVVIGKPVAEMPIPNIDIVPTTVKTPTNQPEWNDGIIVGSETIIDEVSTQSTPVFVHSTSKQSKPTSVVVTSGVTTIFGNLFTRPVDTQKTIIPTKSTHNYHSVISVIVEPDDSEKPITEGGVIKSDKKENKQKNGEILKSESSNIESKIYSDTVKVPTPTTFVVTHTKTLTVTTTETSVEKSVGKEPSTRTLVLTKTQTSTVLDTVTEIHTLVKPTSILSTVTTTVPQVTSTVYTTSTALPTTDKNNPTMKPMEDPHENESIFVVMTDKKPGTVKIHAMPPPDTNAPPPEIQVPDETNEITPNVLLGGILTHTSSDSECRPECKASRNELCQKIDNVMRCVCRPGFARMFPDRPCKPTYTYTMRLTLDHYGKENIHYTDSLQDVTSSTYQRLAEATREGLDRMVMQSDLRDIYHGVAVSGFEPAKNPDNATVKFYVQLSENTEESRLQDVMVKSLRSNNYSLGGTEVFASKENIQYLLAEDFDECADRKFHDCAEDAQCFNLRGTYTCSCKEGFTDLSQNTLFPGRVCSAEQIGCEQCSYHGTCYTRNDVEIVCECFQWYAGDHCQINLKVLLLILVLIGACLMVLLVVCLILACMKHRDHHHSGPPPLRPGVGFRRYKGHGTGDKRAMISLDTSSEGSVEHTPPPYIKQAAITAQRQKVMRKAGKGPAPMAPLVHTHSGTMDQRDRSLTVMIPRAKYRPVPVQPTNTLLTMSTFGPEQKLINYLTPDGANTPEKHGSRSTSRKPSNSTNHSESRHRKTSSQSPAPRKPSTGALVSAGFEVSATVGRTKELDEAFIAEAHTDLSQQGFNTIRTAESSIIVDIPPPPTLEAELEDVIAKVDRLTVSEARSYDETTIQPPTKSLHRDYDSTKHSSSHHANNDEGHTMVERDLGSTFMMPQTHLFKPDRGSDVSNFDSL